MKIIVSLCLILLVILVGYQNKGGRYGSYAAFSWLWLVISVSPIFFGMFYDQIDPKKYLLFTFFLLLVVLIQPAIKVHPVLVLACSLVFVLLFIVSELKWGGDSGGSVFQLNKEDVFMCRKHIAENRLEECFELLLSRLDGEKEQATVIALKQKWNRNRKERNMNLSTNEWTDIQESKVINELLYLLK